MGLSQELLSRRFGPCACVLGLACMLCLNGVPRASAGETSFTFLIALAATLAIVALVYRVRPVPGRLFALWPWLAACLVATGAICELLVGPGLASEACRALGGIGTAYVFCRWFAVLRAQPFQDSLRQLLAAFALSALVRAGVFACGQLFVSVALAFCVIASVALQRFCEEHFRVKDLLGSFGLPQSRGEAGEGGAAACLRRAMPRRKMLAVGLELGAYGMLFGLLRTDLLGWAHSTNTSLIGQIVQIAIPLVLLVWSFASTGPKISGASRAVMLGLAVVVLAAVFMVGLVEPTLSVLMFGVRCLISLLIYQRLLEVSYRYGTHPMVTYGAGRAWFGGVLVIGLLAYQGIVAHDALAGLPPNVIFFFMACVVLLLLSSFSTTLPLAAKTENPDQAEAVRDVSMEERCAAVSARYGLSGREQDVLLLTVRGLSKREASEALGLSENTVRYYVKQIYAKLAVHSRQELMVVVLVGDRPGDGAFEPRP